MFKTAWDTLSGKTSKSSKMTSATEGENQGQARASSRAMPGSYHSTAISHHRSRSIQDNAGKPGIQNSAEQAATVEHKDRFTVAEINHIIGQRNKQRNQNSSLQQQLQQAQKDLNDVRTRQSDTDFQTSLKEASKDSEIRKLAEDLNQERLFCSREHDTYESKVNELEEQLGNREVELSSLQQSIEKVLADTQHNVNQYARITSEWKAAGEYQTKRADTAIKENIRLQKSMKYCKDRIFNTQPFQAMTDNQIAKLYRELCESIESWVATMFEDVEEDLLQKLLTSRQAADQNLIEAYIFGRELMYLKHLPKVEHYVIACAVSRFLFKEMLHLRHVAPGMEKGLEDVLIEMTEEVGKLEPPRGKSYHYPCIHV